MCIVSVDIPEVVRQSTRMDAAATADFACQTVAVAYYTRLHQPIEDCAKIARMSTDAFVELLHASGIDTAITSEMALEAELDAAIAEFDGGKGYPAAEMSARVRERFGW